MSFEAVSLIRLKRDGGVLSRSAIEELVGAYSDGAVPDEQMSAFLMAVYFRGMAPDELAAWTEAMLSSGTRLDLSNVGKPTVDKHSTGGVGDKVSLVLAPLVASCGAAVPQLSGRGLGHTGGTLDKLESIPGFRAHLEPSEMIELLSSVGCVICGAGAGLAPADARLYALRDVTGTVESIPLIASSIMSKKIAEGTSALVLDVKVGTGAFMTDRAGARRLAETMVGLGATHGVKTSAVLTRMDEPLGRAVGNAIEVDEAVETLKGGGPADLVEVTLALAEEMLALAGVEADAGTMLASGAALSTFEEMVRAQGGDPDAPRPSARGRHVVRAERSGFVRHLDALGVGRAAWYLGAGRARKEDPVSAGAGVLVLRASGDHVTEGEPVLELRADDEARFKRALQQLEGAVEIGPEPPEPLPAVLEVIRP